VRVTAKEWFGFHADVLQDEKALHLQTLQEQVNAHYQRACICYKFWRFLGSHVQNIKVEGARFVGLIMFIHSSGLSMCLESCQFWIACDHDPLSLWHGLVYRVMHPALSCPERLTHFIFS
jgi:hypothetical protein